MPSDGRHDAILQAEDRLAERVIDTAGVIVLVLDLHGRVVRLNPYFEQLTGHSFHEVRGLQWFDHFLPERYRDDLREVFSHSLKGFEVHGKVNPILARDGREIEIEWHAKALENEEGEVIGVLSVGRDITDLERTRAWLDKLFETTQDAVVTIDREEHILTFNRAAAEMFGYAREEVEGADVSMLMPEPYASEHASYIERYERTGEPHAIGRIRSVAAKRRSGEVFPIELSVADISTSTETRYGAFIRDVSEKTKLQEQLVEHERLAAIGATTAKFAHEVGNPVNSMQVNLQMLQRRLQRSGALEDEKVQQNIRAIEEELDQAKRLLHDFRALARRQRLQVCRTSLRELIRSTLAAETPYLASHGVQVESALPDEDITVEVDGDRLRQVVVNLCRNAMEAMEEGGTVSVRLKNDQSSARIEVADNGPGLPKDVDVFEPFATTKTHGTGLGLAVARQLVEAHGGTLDYETSPEGTVFQVELPLGP